LLRLGITEFLYFPDIPLKVTINECVDIAKRYSTEKSGKFINGILDSMQDTLQKANRIQKAGRGLIDQ
jgi:transcription antitermination protein NusB